MAAGGDAELGQKRAIDSGFREWPGDSRTGKAVFRAQDVKDLGG